MELPQSRTSSPPGASPWLLALEPEQAANPPRHIYPFAMETYKCRRSPYVCAQHTDLNPLGPKWFLRAGGFGSDIASIAMVICKDMGNVQAPVLGCKPGHTVAFLIGARHPVLETCYGSKGPLSCSIRQLSRDIATQECNKPAPGAPWCLNPPKYKKYPPPSVSGNPLKNKHIFRSGCQQFHN